LQQHLLQLALLLVLVGLQHVNRNAQREDFIVQLSNLHQVHGMPRLHMAGVYTLVITACQGYVMGMGANKEQRGDPKYYVVQQPHMFVTETIDTGKDTEGPIPS
jgi:hypothetical protein